MGQSINKVTLIGNLGNDPEVRSTQGGGTIVTLSIATSESWTDKQSGDKRERVEWHRVVIFAEQLAGVAERYLKKGDKLYVEGALRTRKWTDQAGVERYTTEVVLERFGGNLVMLGSPTGRGSDEGSRGSAPRRAPAPAGADGGWAPPGGDPDDEIPF